MTPPRTLSAALARRILKEIRAGVPSQIAARMCGVRPDVWATWLTRRGRAYKDFAAQVEQAEAEAKAAHTKMLTKLAKRGSVRAVMAFLNARDPEHFPARGPVNIGTVNNSMTLIQQIKALPKDEDIARLSPKARAKAKELATQDPSLIGQIMLMKLREGEFEDPRRVLDRERREQAEREALPPAPEDQPQDVQYEVVGYNTATPDTLDTAPVPQ
jgi:hypothetical protein